MANEPEYSRIQRSSRIWGIALVILVAAGLVYFAPLTILARLERPSGEKRFLRTSIRIASKFSRSNNATSTSDPAEIIRWEDISMIREVKIPLLNSAYKPVLNAASGIEAKQNKFAKFILGID